MRKFLVVGLLALLALAAWTGVILAGVVEGWGWKPLAPAGDIRAFAAAAIAEIDHRHKGNVAFALIRDRKAYAQRFVSAGKPVNGDTLFQVASLSKWITAWGIMTLVDAGKIDLDAPVSTYLKRWHLPPSEFNNADVTVRRLLSHTSGLADGLGYAGFAPGKKVQTIVQSLAATADASPGADGRVRVGYAPGTSWHYSGGGYAVLQLVVEDVTGEPFDAYMRRAVLDPLGMSRSTFVLPQSGATNLAEFYGTDGKPSLHYRYTVVAAASLYTSTADLTRFLTAQLPGPNGEPAGRGVLRPATLLEMRRPHAFQYGVAIWGLGTILYADNNAGGFIVGHDGNNNPAINTAARIDPASGDGIVLLETGNPLLATELAGEWVFWRTGNVDTFMVLLHLQRIFPVLAGGWIVIVLAAIFLGWRMRPRRQSASGAAAMG